jgi:ferredoxin--NADP+ reductase
MLDAGTIRFLGNVEVGRDIAIDDLQERYDAVILATGAIRDAALDIPGIDLPGSYGAADLVAWYDGHPDVPREWPLEAEQIAVIGNGNVALDVARILSKTRNEFEGSDIVGHALEALDRSAIRTITILGRRGPHQIAMTPKELGELAHLEAALPVVDLKDFPPVEADEALEPGQRKSVTILREFNNIRANKPKSMIFDFFARPLAIEGDGHAERVIVERTELDDKGGARGTGETYQVPASLVVSCIGYTTPPVDGVPYDQRGGKFLNDSGHISDRLYCVGWARRGPTGTIGTNRPDGYEVAEAIAAAMPPGSSGDRAGAAGLKSLLAARGVQATDFADWRRIEKAEEAAARAGSPREKMVRVEEWLQALGR